MDHLSVILMLTMNISEKSDHLIILIGALLGKYKRAEVALPGGCNIGSRPIDLHLKGFSALGANVDIKHGLVLASAEKLTGTHIYLDKVSVGATINIMMAASMAEGKTIIEVYDEAVWKPQHALHRQILPLHIQFLKVLL